jgi:hypothetical protein
MPTVQRTRSVDWELKYQNRVNGVSSGVFNVTNDTSGSFVDQVVFGDNLKDFKGRIARLESATTSLSAFSRKYVDGGGLYGFVEFKQTSGTTKQSTEWRGVNGSNIGLPTAPDISLQRAENGALIKLVRLANKELRAVQALVSLGEIGDLLRSIRRPGSEMFHDLYTYLGIVKKRCRGRNNLRRIKDIVSDSWLEWSFGWQPTVADIKGAAEALSRISVRPPPHKVVTARGTDQITSEAVKETLNGGFLRLVRVRIDSQSANVRFRACVKTQPVSFFGDLATFGISLHELIPTVYELIPYSFLVDYFSNLGDVIAGASFNKASIAWCEKGTEQVRLRTLTPETFSVVPPGSGWKEIGRGLYPGSTSSVMRRTVNRSDYSLGSFVPFLEFEIPGLGLKWLNIAALALVSRRTSRAITSS